MNSEDLIKLREISHELDGLIGELGEDRVPDKKMFAKFKRELVKLNSARAQLSEDEFIELYWDDADRVDRLKALGNGQVPVVAALAFMTLLRRFQTEVGSNEC